MRLGVRLAPVAPPPQSRAGGQRPTVGPIIYALAVERWVSLPLNPPYAPRSGDAHRL
jgi:hypothetical protein